MYQCEEANLIKKSPRRKPEMESRTPLEAAPTFRTFYGRVILNLPDLTEEDMRYWMQNENANELRRLLGNLHRTKQADGGWLERILAAENSAHEAFFDRKFNLDFFQQTLEGYGEEKVREWAKLKLEPHFLPGVVLTRENEPSGWRVKPNDWYWQQLAAGKLKRLVGDNQLEVVKQAWLEDIVVLIDTRLNPRYQGGRQMFANDKGFLGEIISQLRENGTISRYENGPQSSRFGVSANEWQEHVRPRVAEKLKLEPAQVRLETAIEANVIPQLFSRMSRVKDGTTDTWVWYEEYFGGLSCRVDGGNSYYGGLANVYWSYSGIHWHYRAFRPLGVLAARPSVA